MSYSELWSEITSALRVAFAELTPLRGKGAVRKRDGSPLSAVDLVLQRLLVEIIEEVEEEKPCVVAEEHLNTVLGRERRCRRVWVIDPLDGTSQFLDRGSIEYCTTVTVLHGRDPVACLIYCPELGRGKSEVVISVAGPGSPVLVNGLPARLASRGSSTRGAFSATRSKQESSRPFEARLGDEVKLRATSLTIDMARSALDLSDVSALGPFKGFYRANERAWDALAGIVVACASGLAAVDLCGSPLTPLADGFLEAAEPTFPNVVLADKDDVRDLLALLGENGPE
ncbi:MAG: inositol monophosphatase family protein [Solirubrobacterales bacterium]